MNWVDVLVAVSVLWSGIRGFFRGFWTQLFVAASVVLGVLAGFWTYAFLSSIAGRGSVHTLHALRFLGAAVVGILVFGLLQFAAERSGSRVNESIFGPVNRMLGLALGVGVGILASALVLLAVVHAPLPGPAHRVVARSWSAPRLFLVGEEATRALGRRVPGAPALADAFARARAMGARRP
jgi:uncharacterized membrane protein required for colicin V production